MANESTSTENYTRRLNRLQHTRWKRLLDVQRPYRWNLERLKPGKTLDIGCGIGRCLDGLPAGSVGIDHNEHSIRMLTELGAAAVLAADFPQSTYAVIEGYDSLLLSHVLEHMDIRAGIQLIRDYMPFLKRDGSVIVMCPQERGFASDGTHVVFLDFASLTSMLTTAGLSVDRSFSFPFPRIMGKLFVYNEFVVTGRKA